ncbi:MAG: transcription-repair coupling factor [Bacteroidia bacterium]
MIQQLLSNYTQHASVNVLCELLTQHANPIIDCKNVVGSAKAFVTAAVYRKLQRPILLVLNDKEEAAYFYNDMQTMLADTEVVFFPASYRKVFEPDSVDNANVLQRAEVLNTLSNTTRPLIIVTHAEALIENVVTQTTLKENTLSLKKGEKINIDFINELLYSYEFDRVDFVAQPGEFSIRGGIVDVFSYSNDYPYRVEFFGNEVDSIRSFDVSDQLSIKHYNNIQIIPNVQGKMMQEQQVSFVAYMPSDTVLAFTNSNTVFEKLSKEYDKLVTQRNAANTTAVVAQLPTSSVFTSPAELYTQTLERAVLNFGQLNYYTAQHNVTFNIKPQPPFNKEFERLRQSFIDNTKQGIENYLFTDTPKQIERIYQIFEDLPQKADEVAETKFTPFNASLHEGFIDHEIHVACYTDHQVFERYHRFKLKEVNAKNKQNISIKELMSMQVGDYVTHIDHGVGRFSGLEKMDVGGKIHEVVRLVYRDNDVLYVSIHSLHRIAKFSGSEGHTPKLNKIGSPAWGVLKQKTKAKVKEIAFDLIKLYAKRKAVQGFAFTPDTYLQHELEASFIYEDTPDQLKATQVVKQDMESNSPMDRLICGDVGFGKTEIAIRAAFKAACDGKQVAVLVPTTILAMQHAKTFAERLKHFPVTVDYVNRFKTKKQEKETLEKVKNGKVDILIGTHRLLSKDIVYKDLGLLIIDEEQKFGVGAKDKLKTLRTNLDTLTLSATPIPRTLQFSMMGARDLSVITTPPPNRYPVETQVTTSSEELIRDAVSYEIARGGQVFFIHNRVANIKDMAAMIQRLVPDARVCVGHGQMEGDELEHVMLSFIEGEYDVLVATTIIESGLDISNANTILINHAENFGLSDLHQMRGRVGRSNKKAFCYLLTPPQTILTNEASRRLRALEEFSDLGSGFNIAMKDLDIRGAGNLLGGEQSGFITEIGFEMYQKILDEAVQELKEEEFGDLFMVDANNPQRSNISNTPFLKAFVNDCSIDTDISIHFPTHYIESSGERLLLYKELDDVKTEEELLAFEAKLIDRFGALPKEVIDLLNVVRLRWISRALGFEKIVMKQNKMFGLFTAKPDSPFYDSPTFTHILKYMQSHQSLVKMAEKNKRLTLSFHETVKTIKKAIVMVSAVGEGL